MIAGRWDFHHLDSNNHTTLSFGGDRTITERDTLTGHWRTVGKTLLIDWEGHGDWHDIFLLPGTDGVLMGVNGSHIATMMTRLDSAAGDETKKAEPPSYFGGETPQ